MTDKDLQTESSNSFSNPDKNQRHGKEPYEHILSQVVTKIRDEPFLFVIAVAAFLIGLTMLATGLGSPDLRFIVIVIAFLAFVAIIGYYIQSGLKLRATMHREEQRYQERFQRPGRGQELDAEKTGPSHARASEDDQRPAGAPKFHIETPNAVGVVIGDDAKVEQHFESPGRALASRSPTPDTLTRDEQRDTLEQELVQHQRNLARLRAKRGVYAAGEEPLSIINQIEAEAREIEHIQAKLGEI